MKTRPHTITLIVLAASFCAAQVTIENPQHLDIPEQRVQVLHNIICRVVAEEFHVSASKVQGPVTLVIGERKDTSIANEFSGVYRIYVGHWDEATFATSDMRLSVLRMTFRDHWERMTREVVRRADQVAPVGVDNFRSHH